MEYEEIWNRIKNSTDIKTMKDLAKIVGSSQPTVSAKKKENKFPVEWAFVIAEKYGLLTEWIMRGTGPIRIDQVGSELEIITQIEKWITAVEKKEPGALSWFKFDFRKKYPEFDKWEKREEDNLPGNISAG